MTRRSSPADDGVETVDREVSAAWGSCEACDWSRLSQGAPSFLAIRAAVRRHVAATGHVAAAFQSVALRYRRCPVVDPLA